MVAMKHKGGYLYRTIASILLYPNLGVVAAGAFASLERTSSMVNNSLERREESLRGGSN